jgi:predicted Zn-dependent protease
VSVNPSRAAVPLFLAALLAVAAPAADPPAKPPTKEEIAEWVKGLASDSFQEREKASKALWKAGEAAEPALRQVLKDGDAEAVRRAREILEKFDWGLYPDTPEAVAQLIDEYRSGTAENRPAVVTKLLDHGGPGFTALMKIAAVEKAPEAKALIWQQLAADMPRLAAALLADGQEARLEQVLEQGLAGEGEPPHANYAAFLLVRGKLDEKVREWQKKAGAAPDKKTALTLAYLCRAKGDLAGARKYAEKAEHPALLTTILSEQEDWKALLKHVETAPRRETEEVNPHGLRLACLRLSGDRDAFDAEVRKLAAEPPGTVSLSVFLLNGRVEDALAVLEKNNQHQTAAEVLTARLRFREALDTADKTQSNKGGDALSVGLFKAGLLARLGERKKAHEIFDKLAAGAKSDGTKPDDGSGALQAVMMAEYSAGFKDEAFARAVALQAKTVAESDFAILNLLFTLGDMETGVEPWWKFLRQKYPKDDAAAALKRLRDLFDRKLSGKDTAALLKEMADDAAKLKPEEKEPALHCAADTCRALGRDDLLEGYLEKWAAAGGAAPAWQRLGDLSADNKRWKEAAERYKKAWEKDRSDALSLYLHGRALVQAGQEKEGRKWMEAAEVLPLGSEEKRYALAAGLAERGLDEAAGKEWERLGRLSLLTGPYGAVVARSLADKAVAGKDYLKAATYYRREALNELAGGGADDPEGHLWLLAAERRCRARGLAAAGRLDDMRKEVRAVQDVEPGNIDLAIDVVTELSKRGQKKEADELLARVHAVHDAVCKEYPKSGWAHNNTAWLLVRCKRNLDAALEHARKGVELEPENAGHLDTLAEVHFQRGDKAKAVELMKKCIEMQPKYVYFRKQLKRMQAGDRDADVPAEPGPGQVPMFRSYIGALP